MKKITRNSPGLPIINKNFISQVQSTDKSLSVITKPTKLKTLKEIIKIKKKANNNSPNVVSSESEEFLKNDRLR